MPNNEKTAGPNVALEPVAFSYETAIKLKQFSDYYIETFSSPEQAKEDLWELLISAISNPNNVADHNERGDITATCKRCMQMIDLMFQIGTEPSIYNIQ